MNCNLCGFKCNVNREIFLGKCKCGIIPKLALASVHMWEEPCISGSNGSGTVFFSGCNVNCIFCQNYEISQNMYGKEVSVNRLAEIFLELQNKNVHNINLVSPTPYILNIIEAIKIARLSGLKIPIIYNTNGYDSIETIKLLNGYIDVYLPDFKYYDNDISTKLSRAPNYFETATSSIKEMFNQVGNPKFNKNGIIKKGLIIRHLILPNHTSQTKKILDWIKNNLSKDVYISIMAQYFPTYEAKNHTLLNRKISKKEYDFVINLLNDFQNGYIQDLSESEEEYVPNFNLDGI